MDNIREGIRKVRFSTILDRWDSGEMTQETAAELLGMSVRSLQRWRARCEACGEAGLVDQREQTPGWLGDLDSNQD